MGCDGKLASTARPVTHDVVAMFDRVAGTYDSAGVEFFSHFGRRLVSVAGVEPGERVLDVGAGRGAVLLAAAAATGPQGFVTGIDLATEMVRLTRQDIERGGVRNAEMRVGDAAAPAFPPEAFDVILGGMVACFLPCRGRAFANYRQLLRPSGRLGLSTFDDAGADHDFLTDLVRRYATSEEEEDAAAHSAPAATGGELLEAALLHAGFEQLDATVEEHVVGFRDHDHWWRWQWSHGQRRLLELVPPDSAAAFRRAAYDELERLRRPDGSLGLRFVVRYTVAHRPDGPVAQPRQAHADLGAA